ncbi:hypothetical protein GN244_ATG05744 [Phytophthora infestans]|uniref:Uncharacterized protein n=1 Tax=Phytophthora infestans TaxID=4787 RepID=A0A833WMC8_PHYIN|nr:hypothetical protein GN244_ATG05744 [Phytophthora infestans]
MRVRFEEYCASIFAAELPVFRSIEEIKCPTPNCTGNLNPLSILPKFKHRLKTGTPPPKTAACNQCEQQLTDTDIASLVIERKWCELDADCKSISTRQATNALGLRFSRLSAHKPTAQPTPATRPGACIRAHVILCERHLWYSLQIPFFRNFEKATQLTDGGEMKYRRSVGNQWLNPYIPIRRRLLHFNMDVRALWSGNSLQAIQYAMQYASKRQSTLDNIDVMELALRRREEREAAAPMTNQLRCNKASAVSCP